MAKPKALLLGASGETGSSILDGLLEHGTYDVVALVRPASASKPSVAKLKEKNVEVRIGDTNDDVDSLVAIFKDIDVCISAIDASSQLAQLNLVDAAKKAGVKRFVPCAFITVAPAKGVMYLRDQKEIVYQHIREIGLPYTVIDVGYWYQLSFPAIPSGKVNYAMVLPNDTTKVEDGSAKTGIVDLRDVGRYVALIIDDDRTINKMVVTFGDVLSQNEIFSLLEEASGEKIKPSVISQEQIRSIILDAKEKLRSEPDNEAYKRTLYVYEYMNSKYIRGDNTPECAEKLGYLNAAELYPQFRPIKFRDFVDELLAGKIRRPYPAMAL